MVKPEETKAVVKANSNQLVVKNPKVIEMVNQLKLMISNGQRLTDNEAIALANFSIIEGLDPFNQEAHLLKSKDGKISGCMVGIKGLRRKAQEQLGQMKPNAMFRVEFKSIAPPNADIEIAVEASLRDDLSLTEYLTNRDKLEKMFRVNGVMSAENVAEMKEILGTPPIWKGLGYFYKREHDPYKDGKYPPQARAEKRAEAAAIRSRFNMNYRVSDIENGLVQEVDETNVIDGEINDASEPVIFDISQLPGGDLQPAQPAQPEDAVQDSVPNVVQRPFSKDHIAEVIAIKAEKYRKAGIKVDEKTRSKVWQLLLIGVAGVNDHAEKVLDWLCGGKHIAGVDDANVLSLSDWLAYTLDSGGSFMVNEMTLAEIQNIVMEK